MEEKAPLEVYAAMFQVQQKLEGIKKDGDNPFTKSRYITLDNLWDTIRPLLKESELLVIQYPSLQPDFTLELTTKFIHVKSGETVSNTLSIPLLVKVDGGMVKPPTSQEIGSAITYARRYSLAAMLGIVADPDDDGNASSKRTEPAKPARSAAIPVMAKPEAPKTRTFGKADSVVVSKETLEEQNRVLTAPELEKFMAYMKQLNADEWKIKKYMNTELGLSQMSRITIDAARKIKIKAEQGWFGPEADGVDAKAGD